MSSDEKQFVAVVTKDVFQDFIFFLWKHGLRNFTGYVRGDVVVCEIDLSKVKNLAQVRRDIGCKAAQLLNI